MKLVIALDFISRKKDKFSDIIRKCILPKMIKVNAVRKSVSHCAQNGYNVSAFLISQQNVICSAISYSIHLTAVFKHVIFSLMSANEGNLIIVQNAFLCVHFVRHVALHEKFLSLT